MENCHPKGWTRNASDTEESSLGWIWRWCTAPERYKPCFWGRNAQTCACHSVWRLASSFTSARHYSHRFFSWSHRRGSFRSRLQVDKEDLFKRHALGKTGPILLRHRHGRHEGLGQNKRLEECFFRQQVRTWRKTTAIEGEIRNWPIKHKPALP